MMGMVEMANGVMFVDLNSVVVLMFHIVVFLGVVTFRQQWC